MARTILCSPRGMNVLGDTFIGIEGVNRGCQQQYAGETKAQRRRNRGRGPVKAKRKWLARTSVSHVVPELREATVHSAALIHGLFKKKQRNYDTPDGEV